MTWMVPAESADVAAYSPQHQGGAGGQRLPAGVEGAAPLADSATPPSSDHDSPAAGAFLPPTSSPAAGVSPVPAEAGRLQDLPDTAGAGRVQTLPDLTAEIHARIKVGRTAACEIAELLARARDSVFKESAGDWLKWAGSEFGYSRRHCFSCLTVGRLLVRQSHQAEQRQKLLGQDVVKLELLAAVKPDLQDEFIRRVPFGQMTRAQLRDKVRNGWSAEDEDDGHNPRPAKPGKARIGPLTAIQALAELGDHDVPTAAVGADVMLAIRGGFRALAIGLYAAEHDVALSEAQAGAIRNLYRALGDELDRLIPQQQEATA